MNRTSRLLLTLSVVALSACGIIGEERSYYLKKDWGRFTSADWLGFDDNRNGFDTIYTSPQRKEQLAEQNICLHKNSQNRIVTQNGVNDSVAYQRCPLAPYASQSGSRMGIRPDGNGTVLR